MSGEAATERITITKTEGGKGQENARTINESRIEPVLRNDRRETTRRPCSGPRCPCKSVDCCWGSVRTHLEILSERKTWPVFQRLSLKVIVVERGQCEC